MAVTATSGKALKHVVYGLVPRQAYFVRVSAFNRAGYGTRRPTTPPYVELPTQKPGVPTSPFNAKAAPTLHTGSGSTLIAKFGPPQFDGGVSVTQYKVEWDTASTFDSASGAPSTTATSMSALRCAKIASPHSQ